MSLDKWPVLHSDQNTLCIVDKYNSQFQQIHLIAKWPAVHSDPNKNLVNLQSVSATI